NRRSVTRNKNLSPVMMRLRLQMLVPVSVRCSWNRRISSAVAVSGERFKYAANRLQLLMWLLCVCGLSLRALMSSIMRWRRGLMASVLMGTLRSEVDDTSSSGKGPRPAIIVVSNAHRARRKTARLRRLSRQRFSALVQIGLARRRAKEALGGASANSSTPSLRANAQTIFETQDKPALV